MHQDATGEVLVFAATRPFESDEAIHRYVHPSYTEDGDEVSSEFMRGVQLEQYEPSCIEIVSSTHPISLPSLLQNASYADQWIDYLPGLVTASQAVCLFSPNRVKQPTGSSLSFCGAFPYRVPAHGLLR